MIFAACAQPQLVGSNAEVPAHQVPKYQQQDCAHQHQLEMIVAPNVVQQVIFAVPA